MDDATLQAVITSKLDGSGFTQAKTQVDELSGKSGSGGLKNLTGEVERGASSLEKLAQHVEYVAGGFNNLRGILFGGAITFGFAEMVDKTTQFNLAADQMTRILNGNAQAGSAWAGIAQALGIDSNMLAMSFAHLSAEVENQRPLLTQLGIAYKDSSGNVLSLNQIIGEAADWFQKNAGASNEAAVAQQLFGRSADALIPLLEQGSSGIAALTAEMQKMGFVMDANTLERQVAFTHALDESKTALMGMIDEIGNAVLPGLAALMQAFADNKGIIDSFSAAITRAVSYVVGFIEGVTGQTLVVSQSSEKFGNLSDQLKNYGNVSQLAGGSTRVATDAIDKQIASLQNQEQAMNAVLDAQIKQLQVEAQQEAFNDKITSAKQKQADDEKRIADDKTKYQQDLLSGNLSNLQSILDDEANAQQDEANQSQQMAKDTADYQRQQQIQALQDQKSARDKDFQDQIKALQDLKAQMTKAGQDGVAGITAAMNTLPGSATTVGNQVADNLKFAIDGQAEAIGKGFGTTFENDLKTHNYLDAAKTVGTAIGDGIFVGLDDSIEAWKSKHISDPVQNFLIWALGGPGALGPGKAWNGSFSNPNWNPGNGVGNLNVPPGAVDPNAPQPIGVPSGGSTPPSGPNSARTQVVNVHIDSALVAQVIAGRQASASRGVRFS